MKRRTVEMTIQGKALDLHRRLLDGDPRAPSEVFELFGQRLQRAVKSSVPQLVDPGDIENAAVDALLRYFREPSAYDPVKSALLTWLSNQARFNALTRLREHGREAGRLKNLQAAVQFGFAGSDKGAQDSDIMNAIEVSEIMEQHGAEIVKDAADVDVFSLMAAGVKDEATFVSVLGLTGSQEANRAEVRRRRDAIRKRLERLREKLGEMGSR